MHKMLLLSCAAAGCALSEDPELSTVESESSVEQWTDGAQLTHGQRSNYQVGLASFGGRLHMLYRSDQAASGVNRPWLKWSRFNGSSWSAPVQLDHLMADYGPSLTVWNDQLVTIYNSFGENRLLMSMSRGQEWSTPVTAGTPLLTSTLAYAPSVVNYRNGLYVAYCKRSGADHQVQVDRFNGYTWSSAATFDIAAGSLCKSVAAAALPGPKFRLVWNTISNTDWPVYEVVGSAITSDLVPRLMTDRKSKKPMSIVHCDDVTHFVHGGYSNPEDVRWSFLHDGQWSDDLWVPGKHSYGGAQLACHDGTTFMVHNLEDESLLRMSEFGP